VKKFGLTMFLTGWPILGAVTWNAATHGLAKIEGRVRCGQKPQIWKKLANDSMFDFMRSPIDAPDSMPRR
jgi:hypothetical protein